MSSASAPRLFSGQRLIPLRFWIETSVIALLGMECLWLASYYRHISHVEQTFVAAVFFLFGVGIASHYLSRGLNRLSARPGLARLILLSWLVAVMLLGLKLMVYPFQSLTLGELALSPVEAFVTEGRDSREFWTLVFSLGFALRGSGLARNSMQHSSIVFSFQASLFLLFIFGWLVAPDLQQQSILALVLSIFLGLVAVFSFKMIRRIEDFGNQVASLNTWWGRNLLVSALVVSFGGAALGWLLHLISPPVMQAIWALIKLVVGLVAISIIGVVQFIVQIILQLLRALNVDKVAAAFFNRLQQISQQINLWSEENVRVTDDPINMGLWIGIAVVIVGVVLFFFIRRWKVAAARSAAHGREDWTELLGEPPKGLIQAGARRAPRRMQAAERVRFIYLQLMDLCEKLDAPRAAAVTPLEFLPDLQELFPAQKEQAETITRAYLRVRYGQFPEDKEDLQRVIRAWEDLSSEGEKLFQARKQAQRYQRL